MPFRRGVEGAAPRGKTDAAYGDAMAIGSLPVEARALDVRGRHTQGHEQCRPLAVQLGIARPRAAEKRERKGAAEDEGWHEEIHPSSDSQPCRERGVRAELGLEEGTVVATMRGDGAP